MGAGATHEDAVMNGLTGLAQARTLRKYVNTMKSPMLVVGSNNWVRGRVPFFLLQQYDLHLLFYPNSTPSWVVGVCALSRIKTDEPPIFVFGCDANVLGALDSALGKVLERCRPSDWKAAEDGEVASVGDEEISKKESLKNTRLGMWWTHWIYRCPKISLKDVLHLEAYPKGIEHWRNYFTDGQEKLSVVSLNNELLPERLRFLVKVSSPVVSTSTRNVNGIGTWKTFGAEALS